MFRKLILILLFICNGFCSISQIKKDSLWSVWHDERMLDTSRLVALNTIIINDYQRTKPDSAIYYLKMLSDFAKSKKLEVYQVNALIFQGDIMKYQGRTEEAVSYYTNAFLVSDELSWNLGMANALWKIGDVYQKKGEFDSALDNYDRAELLFENIGDKKGIANVLNSKGKIYNLQGDFIKAIDFFTQDLNIRTEIEDTFGISEVFNNLGVLNYKLGEKKTAISYFQKSLQLKKEIGDIKGMASLYGNLGIYFRKTAQYDSAFIYFNRCFEIYTELNDKYRLAVILGNFGTLYSAMGDYSKSIDFQKRELTLSREIGSKKSMIKAQNNLGATYNLMADRELKKGNERLAKTFYEQAAFYGNATLAMLTTTVIEESKRETFYVLYTAYKGLGDHQKALFMLEDFVAKRDSLQSEENKRALIKQEYKFIYEMKIATDSVAGIQQKKILSSKIAQQQKEKRVLYIGLFLLLVFGVIMYRLYFISQRRKVALEVTIKNLEQARIQLTQSEKMAALGLLTAGVAHEINNPLNFIRGTSMVIKQMVSSSLPEKEKELKPLFEGMEEGVSRVSKIVKGLNSFSNKNEKKDEPCIVPDILDSCLKMINHKIDSRIVIKKEYSIAKVVFGNVGKLHQVFLNILTNAIQAIEEEGEITVVVNDVNGELLVKIEDNGSGIEVGDISKVMEPFYTTKVDEQGIGLGLYVAYSIVKEHKGNLRFESVKGQGTTALVVLPYGG